MIIVNFCLFLDPKTVRGKQISETGKPSFEGKDTRGEQEREEIGWIAEKFRGNKHQECCSITKRFTRSTEKGVKMFLFSGIHFLCIEISIFLPSIKSVQFLLLTL